MPKLTDYTALATITRGDIFYAVDDPSGAATSKAVAAETVLAGPAILVAANDATDNEKKHADYVCDGIDDQVEIQAAIDAVPVGGGAVYLSGGTFLCEYGDSVTVTGVARTYSIRISEDHPSVALLGVPGATTLKFADDQPATQYLLLICGTGRDDMRSGETYIGGISFDGNLAGQVAVTGLVLVGGRYAGIITVERSQFVGWGNYYGLTTLNITQKVMLRNNRFYGLGAVRLENNNHIVSGNVFDANGETTTRSMLSLALDSDEAYLPGVPYQVDGVSVVGNTFVGGGYQLEMAASRGCAIIGNTFKDQSVVGVYCCRIHSIGAGSGFDAEANIIAGNTFYNGLRAIQLWGESEGTGVLNSIVALNTIRGGSDRSFLTGVSEGGGTTGNNQIVDNNIQATTAISSSGSGAIVRGNIGYVTENHGAAANTADGGTIAHGCAVAPTSVQVSGSVAGEIVTVTGIDATNITVAVKTAAGEAGTPQTMYWRAWV